MVEKINEDAGKKPKFIRKKTFKLDSELLGSANSSTGNDSLMINYT